MPYSAKYAAVIRPPGQVGNGNPDTVNRFAAERVISCSRAYDMYVVACIREGQPSCHTLRSKVREGSNQDQDLGPFFVSCSPSRHDAPLWHRQPLRCGCCRRAAMSSSRSALSPGAPAPPAGQPRETALRAA